MAGKPIRLVYKGKTVPVAWDEDGNVTRRGPELSFPGVPARTIDADEFAVFDIDAKKIKEITGGSDPLYVAEYEDGGGSDNLEEMNLDELRRLAAERGIEGRSSMNKAQLIEALSSGDGGAASDDDGGESGADDSEGGEE